MAAFRVASLTAEARSCDDPLLSASTRQSSDARGRTLKPEGMVVCFSHRHFVKVVGLRRRSLMWLLQMPWARWVQALTFLTALAPSPRYHAERGRCHKTLNRRDQLDADLPEPRTARAGIGGGCRPGLCHPVVSLHRVLGRPSTAPRPAHDRGLVPAPLAGESHLPSCAAHLGGETWHHRPHHTRSTKPLGWAAWHPKAAAAAPGRLWEFLHCTG